MEEYLRGIAQKYARADAREMIYRADFEMLLKSIFGVDGKVLQINHDSTNDNGNKPDFVVSKNEVPLVYIEAKDIGVNLDKIEKSDQMNRYYGYSNLVLTDYLEFRFYRNGSLYGAPVSIATINKGDRTLSYLPENYPLLQKTLLDFASTHREPIKGGAHLARIMGGKARRIKDNVKEMLAGSSDKYSDLLKIRDVVRDSLVTDLDDEKFADMYSQTLVYGLFAARYNDKTPETFSRIEARELVPASNPFLRSFFDHIAGNSFPERLRFIVDELCEVFTHADLEKILKDFYLKEKDTKDPVIHFYEDFLNEYDPKKKMEMGVFYTPRPVVQFIVRAVDSILKSEFNLSAGLADYSKITKDEKMIGPKGKGVVTTQEYHRVQVLDIATGTGTFLNEVIYQVYESFHNQKGAWSAYVQEHLLPRLHGFELMMASYTIAHLKLGLSLSATGAGEADGRLGVYLTNSLDKPHIQLIQPTLLGFMDSITEESRLASKVKNDYPIMVVIGNPPYSGKSMNPHYTENDVYKVEPGGKQKLKERNSKWLNDDYVKFIRLAESMIEKNGEGVLGMITAHGYIDNPTFRGMRWHLRNTFDQIYIVDLHGNSNKDESAEDGSRDENVFDIKTGVSILIGVRKKSAPSKPLARVFVNNIYGKRQSKFDILDKATVDSMKWEEIDAENDVWRVEGKGKEIYMKGFSVDALFALSSIGIVTGKDSFVIDTNRNRLLSRIETYSQDPSSIQIKGLPTKHDFDTSHIKKISYRPFDDRYIYYHKGFIERERLAVMKHFLDGENIGLVVPRQVKAGKNWCHAFVTKEIIESSLISNKTSEIGTVFPLYRYDDHNSRVSNLNEEILERFINIVGYSDPEDIFAYVYGYLYDTPYLTEYSEFLKTHFPRIPFPESKAEFEKYVERGNALKSAHLMEPLALENITTHYPIQGSNVVDSLVFESNKIYINEQQYFDGISERVWNYRIGAYQPAQKYLKDRKGTTLTHEEITHYQNLVASLTKTLQLTSY